MSKNAQDAVIVSTTRTPIGKAYRGAFNDTEAPVLGGHVIRAALDKAGVQGHEVDDVILGIAAQQGTQGYNLGRLCCYTAGLPESVGGMAMDLNDYDWDAYLANDRTLSDPEVVQVERGGRIRLRVINAAAATVFWIETGGAEARRCLLGE